MGSLCCISKMAASRMASNFLSFSRTFLRSSLNSTSANQVKSLCIRSFATSGISRNIFKGFHGLQNISRVQRLQNTLPLTPATQLTIQQSTFSTLQNQINPTRLMSPRIGSFTSGVRYLPTLNQVRRQKPRTKKVQPKPFIPRSERILLGPQRKGVCIKVFIRKPKKPNSAQRKCALLKLSNGKTISAYIPHEKGQLQEHGVVLFEGGRVQDCPGIRFKIIRGKLDMN